MDKLQMLAQMKAVTNAVYLREHAKVKPILDAEARLRGQLSMLKSQIETGKADIHKSREMKTLGVDLLWQKWHMNARRELNQELARVTAQKLRAMDSLKTSFGRKHSVETMGDQEKELRKKLRAKKGFDRLMKLD